MEQVGKIIKPRRGKSYLEKKKAPAKTGLSKETYINGFSKISNVIISDPRLNCQDFRVLAILIFHSFGKDHCNPSQKLIAKETAIGLRSVSRSIKNLKKLKYIAVERTRKASNYILLFKISKK